MTMMVEMADDAAFDVDSDDGSGWDDGSADVIVCEICGRDGFKNERGLKRHRTVTHGGAGNPAKADRAPGDKSGVARRGNLAKLETSLNETLATIGMMVGFVDQFDGSIIVNGGPALSSALVDVARSNKRVEAWLIKATTGFTYGQLVVAVAGIAVPIMAHHGLLPAKVVQGMAGAYGTEG